MIQHTIATQWAEFAMKKLTMYAKAWTLADMKAKRSKKKNPMVSVDDMAIVLSRVRADIPGWKSFKKARAGK